MQKITENNQLFYVLFLEYIQSLQEYVSDSAQIISSRLHVSTINMTSRTFRISDNEELPLEHDGSASTSTFSGVIGFFFESHVSPRYNSKRPSAFVKKSRINGS